MGSLARRPVFAVLADLILVCLSLSLGAAAQRLPEGAYQANRSHDYDLLHLKAALRVDPEAGRIAGRVTLDLTPRVNIERVALDAFYLEIDQVAVDGEAVEAQYDHHTLTVPLGKSVVPGAPIQITVEYSAAPKAGMYFQRDPANLDKIYITTYGEGGLHANWLPLYNDVNDKFTSEMVITVPEGYTVISNGVPVPTDDPRTFHWAQRDKPHSNYLMALYIGDFVRGALPSVGDVSLSYWVPPGYLEQGLFAFRTTPAMVESFSRRFDYPYPWGKYDQIAMPDYPVGAMEHTGVTGHSASVLRGPGAPFDFGGPTFDEYSTDWTAEATISHELAHHWFGDNTTCRNLGHIWLNESFASYLMMLWDEASVGPEQLAFDAELARRHYFEYVAREHEIRPLEYHHFDAPDAMYTQPITYLKGAATLHMLRHELGDAPFFAALSAFLKKHQFGNVESHDLKIAIEETTGRNLETFFAQWVTGAGAPQLEVSYRYRASGEEDGGMLDLQVNQVQPLVEGQGYFDLSVPVVIHAEGPTGRVVTEHRLAVRGPSSHFLLPVAGEPEMVSFDGGGHLVARIDFPKLPEALRYQSQHDALVGRMRALGQLARRYPTRPETVAALTAALDPKNFWALQAEAAQLLGTVRTPAAEALVARALGAEDYRVRKAAVLALPHFGTPSAIASLLRQVKDPHSDVVGTAIVALARAEPELHIGFLEEQLQRDAWFDEIRIAALRAARELAQPRRSDLAALAALVAPYAGPAYNQDARQAALEAWEAAAPDDTALHQRLLAQAEASPYLLQKYAIEALGRLGITAAEPLLKTFVEERRDPNLVVLARDALGEIHRLR
jgi:aminopeptidase N